MDSQHIKRGFTDAPEARIYYEMLGEGEPLVLVHGGFIDRRMWDDQFQFFAQNYRVIRFDVPGMGDSENLAPAEPHTYYKDLHHVFAHLGIRRASLVGLSLGSRVSIDFAIAYPERVHKLVLTSPGLSGYQFSDEPGQRGREMTTALKQGDIARAVEVFLTMWTDGPKRTPAQVDPTVREKIRMMAIDTISKHRMASGRIVELEPPALGRLAEIHAPTLILVGDQDYSDILTIGQLLHKGIAHSELTLITDVAHMVNMEKPAEFNRLVSAFLQLP